MLFKLIPEGVSDLIHWNNSNSNWDLETFKKVRKGCRTWSLIKFSLKCDLAFTFYLRCISMPDMKARSKVDLIA